MIDSVIHTNEHSIARVLGAGLPVALIFWRAGSLTPAQDQLLDNLARRYAGRALIAKVSVQDEPVLAKRYAVADTPTAIFVKNNQTEGVGTGPDMAARVEEWLGYLVDGGKKPAGTRAAAQSQTERASTPSGDNHPIALTDATFEATINRDVPVLVDFWAAWCGPCRMIAPAVEQLAREFAGRAVVAKLNVDENPVTAQRYQVMSIPTLYIFKRGTVVDRIVGAQPAQVLRDRLAYHAG